MLLRLLIAYEFRWPSLI